MGDVAYINGLPLVKVEGGSEQVGKVGAKLYRYAVYVEEATRARKREFARKVEAILADKRGWIRGGRVAFQRVEDDPDTFCILATPDSVDKLCAPLDTEGKVSCCMGAKVVINVHRWRRGVPHWTGPIATYRQMVVNHEFGHRTGHGHGTCPGPGKLAPCMQQQTYGLQGCLENSWPLDSEL